MNVQPKELPEKTFTKLRNLSGGTLVKASGDYFVVTAQPIGTDGIRAVRLFDGCALPEDCAVEVCSRGTVVELEAD